MKRMSKNTMRVTVLFITACFFVGILTAQSPDETVEINSRTYVRYENTWFFEQVGGERFQLDPSVISVRVKAEVAPEDAASLHRAMGVVVERLALTGFADVRIPPGTDIIDLVRDYLSDPRVAVAEPNTIGRYGAVPNDPSYGSQWHHPIMESDLAWDKNTGDPGVIVAILDSGSAWNHEDMGMGPDGYQNIWLNQGEDAWSDPNNPATGNGVDDDNNGFIDDYKGWDFPNGNNDSRGPFSHGTNVAGLVGAKTNNGVGISGVAGGWNGPGVQMMICGVGDSAPSGAILDDAILYAAQNGARVIQMSLTVGQSSAIDAAIQMAHDDFGVFIACASGNNGQQSVGYPSIHQQVVSVGSTNQSDQRSSFSNHGPDLDISAPGSNIFTTTLNNGYTTSSGTSFAAPILSACAALIFSADPNLTNDQVKDILLASADKVGGYNYNWDPTRPGHSRELGYGRVNPFAALCSLGVELYIKDSPEDTGGEPNLASADNIWGSPDIWNCVDDPNCETHQAPVFGADNHLRVRVRSISGSTQPSDLHLYWTRARTGEFWPDHWLHPDDFPAGNNMIDGEIGGAEITVVDNIGFVRDPIIVPPMASGSDLVFSRGWDPPDPSWYPLAEAPGAAPMIGLLARLVSDEDPITNDLPGVLGEYVADNNNVATRNSHLVAVNPLAPVGMTISNNVHNVSGSATALDLRIEMTGAVDGGYPGEATLILGQDLWDAWVGSGQQGVGITTGPGNQVVIDDPTVGGSITDIDFADDAYMPMGVVFSLPPEVNPTSDERYHFTLSQMASGSGDQVGAVTFDVDVLRDWMGLLADWPNVTILDIINRFPASP